MRQSFPARISQKATMGRPKTKWFAQLIDAVEDCTIFLLSRQAHFALLRS